MIFKLDLKTDTLDVLTVIVFLYLIWPLLPKPTRKEPKTATFHQLIERKQEAG